MSRATGPYRWPPEKNDRSWEGTEGIAPAPCPYEPACPQGHTMSHPTPEYGGCPMQRLHVLSEPVLSRLPV